jgi:serine protease
MNACAPASRWFGRAAAAAAVALAVTVPAASSAGSGAAHPNPGAHTITRATPEAGPQTMPYVPGYRPPARTGAVPTRGAAPPMRLRPPREAATQQTRNVLYRGGTRGIGVTTGRERVYLVFFGSQWGHEVTSAQRLAAFSGDPDGVAPYVQRMFRGLGTDHEQWSGVMTQYCQETAFGAQTCPPTAPHVAYPAPGGTLAGVWADESTAAPFRATGHQLAAEALRAAARFGNRTAASNRDAMYVIMSPTGTHPDGFDTPKGAFCAWHDYNGDPRLSGGPVASPFGPIAFVNMPYVPNIGRACGQDFVNIDGTLDGVSIVLGHEYAETITDQNPPGGWVDLKGQEVADKCAWLRPDTRGGAADIRLATGVFPMQAIWGNDDFGGQGGCEISHHIVSTELLRNPDFETGSISPWIATPGVLMRKSSTYPPHSGVWLARLDGRGGVHTDTLSQEVTIPATYGAAALEFWLDIRTNDPATAASDTLTVDVLSPTGAVLRKLATFSNRNPRRGHYQLHVFAMRPFIGKTVRIKFIAQERLAHHSTAFLVDDAALNAY